jgi:hypothetical protein
MLPKAAVGGHPHAPCVRRRAAHLSAEVVSHALKNPLFDIPGGNEIPSWQYVENFSDEAG